MGSISNIMEKIRKWLSTGTDTEAFIRKALVIAAAILIIYRVGYAVGKLFFHISS